MDHRRSENLYAVVSPGLESVCAAELAALEITTTEIQPGGVAFSGRLREIYLANLRLRTASRILVRFAEFRSRDFPTLYRRAKALAWGRFVRPDSSIAFRVTCHSSRLNHTDRIAETLESAANQTLGRVTNPAGSEPQQVLVRIVDDLVTLSIDSSGELLHRRGYRQSTTKAPLRETLAAGILSLLGWQAAMPLRDPMCGSGSFLCEAFLLACNRAPGLERQFAFANWPGYRDGLWTLLCDEARRAATDKVVDIRGADDSADAVAAARDNIARCSGADQLTVERLALAEQPRHSGSGLVICNPPYGKRLTDDQAPTRLYTDFGRHLKRAFPGWQLAMVCPDPALIKATGLPFRQLATLNNGGLKVGLYATKA